MKNMSTPPSGKTVFSSWKVGTAVGIACLTGLVAIIGYGSGPSGTLSKFSQSKVTSKTAASLWAADTSSEHRKRLSSDYAPRVDGIVVAILKKGSNLQNVAFRSYLNNLSSGIRALGDKPAYAGNEEISSIINYLAVEIGATATSLDTTGDFLDDAENIVSGGAYICPMYDMPNPPPFCTYSFIKDETGCEKPVLACEDKKPVCTQEYKPVCAQQLFQMACPVNGECPTPAPKTYSNACMAGLEQAVVQYEGECNSGCKVPPELTKDEAGRGCSYQVTPTLVETKCPVYSLVCSNNRELLQPPKCPLMMPALLTDEQKLLGCRYDSYTGQNGCPAMKLTCPSTPVCTKEYAPVCATKTVPCDAPAGAACMSIAIPEMYNNSCLAKAAGATIDPSYYFTNGKCIPVVEEPQATTNGIQTGVPGQPKLR